MTIIGFDQLPQTGHASGWSIWRPDGQVIWQWCAYHLEHQARGTARSGDEAGRAARLAQRRLKQDEQDARQAA